MKVSFWLQSEKYYGTYDPFHLMYVQAMDLCHKETFIVFALGQTDFLLCQLFYSDYQ